MGRTRKEPKSRSGPIDFEAKLWAAADAMRNNMDAAEYKHVVLGLIFLKYISDAFEAKHAELEALKKDLLGAARSPLAIPQVHGAAGDHLVKTVRANVTIDWTMRENVQAHLRVLVKRILRKYGYPPDKQEKATQTVLEQAALLSGNWAAGAAA